MSDDAGGGIWGIPDGYGAANKGGAIGISLSNGKNNKSSFIEKIAVLS